VNLETKWLEDFVALANTRSFSASARQRHVTQPAFSRRIRALEQAVDVTLVDRSTTPVGLTPEGQLFLVTARNLVEQLNESLSHLRGLSIANEALDIVAAHSLALSFYPPLDLAFATGVGRIAHTLSGHECGRGDPCTAGGQLRFDARLLRPFCDHAAGCGGVSFLLDW